VTGLPRAFGEVFAYGRVLGLPAPLVATVAIFLVLYFLLHWTRFGRYLYAIGSNSRAARLSGIPVGLHVFLAHTLCAITVAAAAILLTARVNTGEARIGEQYALTSITACVLGGVSLFGGSGQIVSVILGAFFLTLLTNGMTMLRIGSFAQIIADGSLLIFAVWAEQGRLRLTRRREEA
jgi:ribose transport system permease protein